MSQMVELNKLLSNNLKIKRNRKEVASLLNPRYINESNKTTGAVQQIPGVMLLLAETLLID